MHMCLPQAARSVCTALVHSGTHALSPQLRAGLRRLPPLTRTVCYCKTNKRHARTCSHGSRVHGRLLPVPPLVRKVCYCKTTFDHGIGEATVNTPAGCKTMRQVCRDIELAYGPAPLGGRECVHSIPQPTCALPRVGACQRGLRGH